MSEHFQTRTMWLTGIAMVAFAAVQLTMFVSAFRNGEHFPMLSWVGLAIAVAGLVYLLMPGVFAPNSIGVLQMAVAGVAWGFYSLLGRHSPDPLGSTTKNFVYAVPLVLIVSAYFFKDYSSTSSGLALAVVSGAVASGCGYVIWYGALKKLSATHAATVQLSVPAIASVGGVILLGEQMTMRLVLATVLTLGGVGMVLSQRTKPR